MRIKSIKFSLHTFKKYPFKQFFLKHYNVGFYSYIVLELKFEDNCLYSCGYKLKTQFLDLDIEYIERLFIIIKNIINNINRIKPNRIKSIKLHYILFTTR